MSTVPMRPTDPDPVTAAIEQRAEAWMLLLRSGKATAEDAQAFKLWCAENPVHAQAAQEMRKVWKQASVAAAVVARQEAASGQAWTGRRDRTSRVRTGRRAFLGAAVAAGASWLAIRPPLQLWPSLGDLAADYRTGTGEQRQVTLANRVVIEMNTQTRLNLRSTTTTRGGIELVAGEAEVFAGTSASNGASRLVDPFIVAAGNGRLQTSDARFVVRRDADDICVTCVAGAVLVEHPRGSVTLSAAQQVVYTERNVGPVSQVDPAMATAWRRGMLFFNDVPLAQVVDEINRYRPGKIILRNAHLGGSRVRAKFSIHHLDDAIALIREEYGARVTELPGGLVLLS